jgi:isopentenyl phosphate kinase
VHDASCERKTAENLIVHLKEAIKTVRVGYHTCVVGVVTDASGECRKARRLLALEYPDIVFLDCYAHQVCF